MSKSALVAPFVLLFCWAGCVGDGYRAPTGSSCSVTEPSTCEGQATLRSCQNVHGKLAWVTSPCSEGRQCAAGRCIASQAVLQAQAQLVSDYTAALKDNTACATPVDWDGLSSTATSNVLT